MSVKFIKGLTQGLTKGVAGADYSWGWPIPGSQIMRNTRKKKACEKFYIIFVLPFLNSADPTISEPGTG